MSRAKTHLKLALPCRFVVLLGRDRCGSPNITLGRRDRADREVFLLSGRTIEITWGGYRVRPQLNRDGAALGRLWVEWT